MENASKALIMAAGVLIGIMLLSFMIYIFKSFGDTSKETERRMSEREIEAFNAKFNNYETGGNHNLNDEIGYNIYESDGSQSTLKYEKYSTIFKDNDTLLIDSNKKEIIELEQKLNMKYELTSDEDIYLNNNRKLIHKK